MAASIDGVQPGLTLILLQSVWLPTLPSVTGAHEEKLLSAATAAMLADAPQLAAPESAGGQGRGRVGRARRTCGLLGAA